MQAAARCSTFMIQKLRELHQHGWEHVECTAVRSADGCVRLPAGTVRHLHWTPSAPSDKFGAALRRSPSDVSVFPKVFVDAHEFTDRDWKFQLLGGTERVEAKFVPEPSHWSRIAQRVQTQI